MKRKEFYELCEQANFSDSVRRLELRKIAGEHLLLKVILMQWEWHHDRGTHKPVRPEGDD